jgi:hypothetical protein
MVGDSDRSALLLAAQRCEVECLKLILLKIVDKFNPVELGAAIIESRNPDPHVMADAMQVVIAYLVRLMDWYSQLSYDHILVNPGRCIHIVGCIYECIELCLRSPCHSNTLIAATIAELETLPETIPKIQKCLHEARADCLDSFLVTAIGIGNLFAIRRLLESGLVRVDRYGDNVYRRAFLTAVESNSVECVALLLKHNADFDVLTSGHKNVLHIAVEKGNEAMVALLCEHAQVRHITGKTLQGISPISLVEQDGRNKMFRTLLTAYKQQVARDPSLAVPELAKLAKRYRR